MKAYWKEGDVRYRVEEVHGIGLGGVARSLARSIARRDAAGWVTVENPALAVVTAATLALDRVLAAGLEGERYRVVIQLPNGDGCEYTGVEARLHAVAYAHARAAGRQYGTDAGAEDSETGEIEWFPSSDEGRS